MYWQQDQSIKCSMKRKVVGVHCNQSCLYMGLATNSCSLTCMRHVESHTAGSGDYDSTN